MALEYFAWREYFEGGLGNCKSRHVSWKDTVNVEKLRFLEE